MITLCICNGMLFPVCYQVRIVALLLWVNVWIHLVQVEADANVYKQLTDSPPKRVIYGMGQYGKDRLAVIVSSYGGDSSVPDPEDVYVYDMSRIAPKKKDGAPQWRLHSAVKLKKKWRPLYAALKESFLADDTQLYMFMIRVDEAYKIVLYNWKDKMVVYDIDAGKASGIISNPLVNFKAISITKNGGSYGFAQEDSGPHGRIIKRQTDTDTDYLCVKEFYWNDGPRFTNLKWCICNVTSAGKMQTISSTCDSVGMKAWNWGASSTGAGFADDKWVYMDDRNGNAIALPRKALNADGGKYQVDKFKLKDLFVDHGGSATNGNSSNGDNSGGGSGDGPKAESTGSGGGHIGLIIGLIVLLLVGALIGYCYLSKGKKPNEDKKKKASLKDASKKNLVGAKTSSRKLSISRSKKQGSVSKKGTKLSVARSISRRNTSKKRSATTMLSQSRCVSKRGTQRSRSAKTSRVAKPKTSAKLSINRKKSSKAVSKK